MSCPDVKAGETQRISKKRLSYMCIAFKQSPALEFGRTFSITTYPDVFQAW